jgi:hypothetical protein
MLFHYFSKGAFILFERENTNSNTTTNFQYEQLYYINYCLILTLTLFEQGNCTNMFSTT